MDDELLCLAFCTITETNRKSEMDYIAGCILNRVRNCYRGKTVREVVLADWQFSAFKSHKQPSAQRDALMNSDPETAVAGFNAQHGLIQTFEDAITVSGNLLTQEELFNPWLNGEVDHPRAAFVHHYFSPVSMHGATPAWYDEKKEVVVAAVEKHRFKFFHDVP